MKQQDSRMQLSPLETTMLDLQAQGAAVALYSAINETALTQESLAQDSVRSGLNANYMVAFEYLAGIYSQQPKQQEVMRGLESKISAIDSSLDDLLKGGEEQQAFLNKMYADSIKDAFGEGEEGAVNYLNSHLGAQETINSAIMSSDDVSKESLGTLELLSNMYTISTINQAQEIFGALPAQYQHLLENSANDNSAPSGYNIGDRDAA